MTCPYCNAEIKDDSTVCKFCSAQVDALKNNVISQPQTSEKAKDEIGMLWYKFQIYFMLFYDALTCVISGVVNLISSLSQGGIYADYPILKPINFAFGVFAIAVAALLIVTRFRLAKFKKNAPKMFYAALIAQSVLACGYEIACLIIVGLGGDFRLAASIGELFLKIDLTVFYVILNAIYFDRRKHLFVN